MAKKKTPPKPHPTVTTVIKRAAVDILMAPLVDWLNSFEEVTTLFCCQGEASDDINKPYVLFTCLDPLHLMTILQKFGACAVVEVSYSREYPLLRYTALFHNRDTLQMVIDGIKDKK